MEKDATQAMIRFGWGSGAGTPPADPAAWLAEQLTEPDPTEFPPNLPSSADGLVVYREQLKLRLPPINLSCGHSSTSMPPRRPTRCSRALHRFVNDSSGSGPITSRFETVFPGSAGLSPSARLLRS
jgi:hypothetical protein